MSLSVLKLNLEKTEFIIFGSHAQLKKLDLYQSLRIFSELWHSSAFVKNLGVLLYANFSFGDHIRNIFKTCFIQMLDLRQIREYQMHEAVLASNALVISRLDQCNFL